MSGLRLERIQPWGDMWRIRYTDLQGSTRYAFKTKRDHPDELSVLKWWLKYTGANQWQ